MMKIKEFGKRLKDIEKEYIKINNSSFPEWMRRDADIKRNKAVGQLIKETSEVVLDEI